MYIFGVFFGGLCCSYTRFQHDRHDNAIGVKGETLLTVLSKPKFSHNILRNDLHRILKSMKIVSLQYTDDGSDVSNAEGQYMEMVFLMMTSVRL